MEKIKPAIVHDLRDMARRGATVPQMLRTIFERSTAEQPHTVVLIQYLREAFCLTLRQASPVGGWMPDGSGELSDAQLNDLIMPEIRNNRSNWDTSEAAAAP